MTSLPAELEASYRATVLHYYDADDVHYVARPLDHAPAARPDWDLPGGFHVVTAHNPGSQKRSAAQNRVANAALADRLRALGAGLAAIDGRAPDGTWREPSYAVWNVCEDEITSLMRELGQAAFFSIEEGRRRLGSGTHSVGEDFEWLEVSRRFEVDDAVRFAARAHKGQADKGGDAYVLHPIRVALRLRDERQIVAALLHDVVEDTGVTLDELRRRGVDLAVLEAIDALTRREGEDYLGSFIERIRVNPIATPVKLADIADNLSPVRLHRLKAGKREELRAKYEPARERLWGAARDRRLPVRRWKWVDGTVDRDGEHLQLVHDGEVVARLAPPRDHVFVAEIFTTAPDVDAKIRRELDFYLLELAARNANDAWKYAIYHCGTNSNAMGDVHWGYWPRGAGHR